MYFQNTESNLWIVDLYLFHHSKSAECDGMSEKCQNLRMQQTGAGHKLANRWESPRLTKSQGKKSKTMSERGQLLNIGVDLELSYRFTCGTPLVLLAVIINHHNSLNQTISFIFFLLQTSKSYLEKSIKESEGNLRELVMSKQQGR